MQRSPDALIQTPPVATPTTNFLPWAQRVVLAAGTGLIVSLLAVVLLTGLGRGRARRRARDEQEATAGQGAQAEGDDPVEDVLVVDDELPGSGEDSIRLRLPSSQK